MMFLLLFTLVASSGCNKDSISGFTAFLQSVIPIVNEQIPKVLPKSVGDCGAGAPTPCQDTGGKIFDAGCVDESAKAYSSFAGGIDSLNITSASASCGSDGSIKLATTGEFTSRVWAALHGEVCFFCHGCSTVVDATCHNGSPCDVFADNEVVDIALSFTCGSNGTLATVSLDNIAFHIPIKINIDMGVKTYKHDITGDVSKAAASAFRKYANDDFLPALNKASQAKDIITAICSGSRLIKSGKFKSKI